MNVLNRMRVALLWGMVWATGWAQVAEKLEVRLFQVTARVVDAAGQPVTGLNASDFRCTLDGIAVEPQGVRPETDASTAHSITVFLDTSLMDRQSFDGLMQHVGTALAALARTGQTIKLVHFDDALVTVVSATSDAAALVSGVSQIACKASFRAQLTLLQNDLTEAYAAFRRSVDSGEARDMIRFNAENVFQKIAEKERAKLAHFHRVCAQLVALCDEVSSRGGRQDLYWLTGGLYLEKNGRYEDTTQTLRRFADHINRSGVTIHVLVHNGEPAIGLERLQVKNRGFFNNYQAMKDLAAYSYQQVRTQIELLDAGGNTLAEGQTQVFSGPTELARWTGGRIERSNPNFVEQGLPAFFSSHRVGYEFDFPLVDAKPPEEVVIELAQDGPFQVLFPRTFRPPRPFSQWTQSEVESSFQRLLFFGRLNEGTLPCEWGARVFQLKDGTIAVPVFGGFKGARAWKKGLEVGFVALGSDDRVLDIVHETISGKNFSDQPLVYDVLLCETWPATVRFFARELGAGAFSVDEADMGPADDEPESGPVIGGVNLGTAEGYDPLPLPHLRTKKADPRHKERAKADPFLVEKRLVIPSLRPVFRSGDDVPVFFHLWGATGELAGYGFDFYMTQGEESKIVPGKLSKITRISEGEYKVEGFVTLKGLEVGTYLFTVVVFSPSTTPIQKSCYAWITDDAER